jgi:hypothetical protein
MICPVCIWTIEQTAKAEEPPPAGSTARQKWFAFIHPWYSVGSLWILARRLGSTSASTSLEGKAFVDPSAPTPMDSRTEP